MASNNFWKTWHEYIFCLEGSTKTKNRVEFPKQVSGGIHQTKYFRVESSRQHFVWLTTTYFPCLEGCVWKKTIFEDILVKSNHHEMCPCLERCVWKSTLNLNTHTFRNLPLFVRGFKNTTKAITATTKNIHRKQMLSKNGKGRPWARNETSKYILKCCNKTARHGCNICTSS